MSTTYAGTEKRIVMRVPGKCAGTSASTDFGLPMQFIRFGAGISIFLYSRRAGRSASMCDNVNFK